LLYGNFFDDDHDLETVVAGIKEAIRIASQKPFLKIGAKLYNAVVPGCEGLQFNSHEYWRCYAMHLTTSFHHQVEIIMLMSKTQVVSDVIIFFSVLGWYV
jgi:hypothetical protein